MAQGNRGRPISWTVVAVVVVGFAIGGFGLVLGPSWWLVVVGAVVCGAGGVVGLATGIMDDWH
jgi:fatty acid desaturase